MLFILSISTIDPALGRVDPSLMAEESLLATFFDGCMYKSRFTYEDGDINPSAQCFTRNEEKAITEIFLSHAELKGSLNFVFLPPTVEYLAFQKCFLQGNIDVTHWPQGLLIVALDDNQLQGEINTSDLPRNMTHLSVAKNQLSGPFETSNLPKSLECLDISSNHFSGTFDLKAVHPNLESIEIHQNSFSGDLYAKALSDKLNFFDAASNKFTAVDIASVSANTGYFSVEENPLVMVRFKGNSLESLRAAAHYEYGGAEIEWVMQTKGH